MMANGEHAEMLRVIAEMLTIDSDSEGYQGAGYQFGYHQSY